MSMQVYLDYAATTFTAPEVVTAMTPFFTESFGNPSSIYSFSERNRKAIAKARQQVADVIGASADEIFFTSGGTEADNWALKGAAWRGRSKGNHIITTKIEHHAVLHTAQFLQENGFDVTFLDVDAEGRVNLDDIRKAVTEKTILVSVMFANNEIGTIQPVAEIGAFCREKGILFHTDAVQAVAHVPIDVKAMNIDMLSLSAHKFYGPKGVGALYIRKGTRIENFMHGGGQEKGRRATTENVPGIVGLGAAIELTSGRMSESSPRIGKLRDMLIEGVMESIPHAKLNGAPSSERLPNNANFSFIGIEGETLLLDLDSAGIYGSTGSACSSGSLDPSHVLMAIGLSHELAHGSLRLTLGEEITEEDIQYVLSTLPGIVKHRREMSPLWEDYMKKIEGGR
ncbi:cysteine desulfurase NifS [Aminivibrio sp.]|jgi:cysteine desulfurase|uniref:cysteine desulfurase NifS n=1 Tax=Aminivibrio sp. TaxID=1872489 RepID=UPI0016AE06D1|nr:cysteine desulfurase NifS [Synergistaceae bacterium]